MKAQRRCAWAGEDPLYVAYHDEEWGVPVHDDRVLFEFLLLEGAQAGLSWITILRKRQNYRRAFADFDAARVARFTAKRIEKLLGDEGLVRNRLKIEGAVRNARACLAVQQEFGSFDAYLWRFVDGRPLQNRRQQQPDVPAKTPEAEALIPGFARNPNCGPVRRRIVNAVHDSAANRLSKDLRRRDFTFVGPTICYAFMQAVGMVNDHLTSCFRHRPLRELR